jgi:hypothetical protein
MAINFGGGETSSFVSFNSIETVQAGTFKTPARCGIHTKKSGWIMAEMQTSANSQWFHFDLNIQLISNNITPIQVLNSSQNVVFSISTNGNIIVGNSPIGTLNLLSTVGLRTIDIKLSNNNIEIYSDARMVFSASGAFTAISNMQFLRLSPVGTDATENTNTIWSQVIISDETTIGLELATLVLTSQGDLAAWTGQVNSINEIIYNNLTFISAPISDLFTTYTISALPSQYTDIKAVVVNALARYSGQGPSNIESVVRFGSSNSSQAMSSLGIGYTASNRIHPVNPFTGVQWLPAELNNSQFGFRSRP